MKEIVVCNQMEWRSYVSTTERPAIVRIRAKENIELDCDATTSVIVKSTVPSACVTVQGISHVVAEGQSYVIARDMAHVDARDRSHVEARDWTRVNAHEESYVVTRDWGQVVSHGRAHVVAWDQSRIVAYGESCIVAGDYTCVWTYDAASVHLRGQAVCFVNGVACTSTTASSSATIIHIDPASSAVNDWLKAHGIVTNYDGVVTLYKRVSADYYTQEGRCCETRWLPGTAFEHPHWNPAEEECGAGKYHACPYPYFCDDFREASTDRYIAIDVAVGDLFAWGGNDTQYPHKIAFRRVLKIAQCDQAGNPVVCVDDE